MIVASLFFYILNYGLQLALAMLMLMKEIPENIMDYVSVGIMILRCVFADMYYNPVKKIYIKACRSIR